MPAYNLADRTDLHCQQFMRCFNYSLRIGATQQEISKSAVHTFKHQVFKSFHHLGQSHTQSLKYKLPKWL